MVNQQTIVDLIGAGVIVLGGLALHNKTVEAWAGRARAAEANLQRWIDAHTTPAERAIVDQVARAGVAELKTQFPALAERMTAAEKAIATLQTPVATDPAATKGA